MSKRPIDDAAEGGVSLKSGGRPQELANGTEPEGFEDEYEDEYESEGEFVDAGVDGRPDAEREIEEKGRWMTPKARCEPLHKVAFKC